MTENKFFPEVKGNFGFGCMRLPIKHERIDRKQFSAMVDKFIAAGFNYFDTAHGYHNGKSETTIKECLVDRYKRSDFLLTDKLTEPYFSKQSDIRPFFESQLRSCGVDYFDFYLMHAQNKNNYVKFTRCKAYETALELKKEGLIRHLGISFHDKAEVLDMILSAHPEIEVVQIQLNYVDFESASVESRKVYEVCEKYDKPVIVMEPVKGGMLVNLPEEADKALRDLNGCSNAGYALRFAAGFKNIAVVLSGMSDMAQVEGNVSVMGDFKPLDEREQAAIDKVLDIFNNANKIQCTACRYCVEENHCPKNILIPEVFSAYNAKVAFRDWNSAFYYNHVVVDGHGKASDCIKCGMCEKVCPQHLPIRKHLEKAAETFGK